MAILIDADVIIQSEREAFGLAKWMEENGAEQFEIAAVTLAELWRGIERSTPAQRRRREHHFRSFIELLPVVPYTGSTALVHARIWAELSRAGRMIGYYDLIVAATALERGSALATFNRRHFSQVRGLKLIKPG